MDWKTMRNQPNKNNDEAVTSKIEINTVAYR